MRPLAVFLYTCVHAYMYPLCIGCIRCHLDSTSAEAVSMCFVLFCISLSVDSASHLFSTL